MRIKLAKSVKFEPFKIGKTSFRFLSCLATFATEKRLHYKLYKQNSSVDKKSADSTNLKVSLLVVDQFEGT